MVNATDRPCCTSRFIWTSAFTPPRDDDPRTTEKPNRSMMREIHSPSKFSLVMTTIWRSRQKRVAGRMRPCQKVRMGCCPAATSRS